MPALDFLVWFGSKLRTAMRNVGLTLALGYSVLRSIISVRTWRRTVRYAFVDQMHQIGVGALPAVIGMGSLIGLVSVFQAIVWQKALGESDVIQDVLVTSMITQVAPLLTALIVVGRSATLMSVALGRMVSTGQLRTLDTLGIDPLDVLVIPRVLAASISCLCLTVVFVCAALMVGYLAAILAQVDDIPPGQFLEAVLHLLTMKDFILVLSKALLSGLVASIVACSIGMSPQHAARGNRRLLPRSFVLGSLSILVISVLLSVLI